MMKDNTQAIEESQPKIGPGDRLQTARISLGMTLDDVASKMHLSTSIISSLEENNFDDITAPIFVKGYLRAYSRLVDVSEEEIIQQYSTYYMNGDPPISSTSNTSPEINADDSSVKWVTYIVILALIGLLSAWWWNRYQQSPETLSLDTGNQTQIETQTAELEPTDSTARSPETSIETAGIDPAQESIQQEIQSVVETLQAVNIQTEEEVLDAQVKKLTASLKMQDSTEMDATDAEVEQAVSAVLADQPEIETPPAVVVPEPVITNVKKEDLVITVNADTWASIKDANGKKLVKDLLRAGEEISVSGKAPLNVFLGNGYGVNMRYKGKNVDISGVIQPNNTARIKVGQ